MTAPPIDLTAPPDFIVVNGRTIDPASGLDGPADVAVAKGRILAVGPDLAARYPGAPTHDAAGCLVTPGLIDMHTHVFTGLGDFCLEADQVGVGMGVTTVIDAGTAGAAIFGLARKGIIDHPATKTRVLGLVDPCQLYLANKSFICHKLEIANDLRNLDLEDTARVVEEHGDVIVGFKVRACHVGDPTVSPFVEGAKEIAGDRPIMIHLGGFPHTPVITTDALLNSLRGGDIITHCFRAASGILDDALQPTDAFRAALDRGLRLDIGHSGGDFHLGTARHMVAMGIPPNTISTDLNVYNIDGPVYSLAETMTKLWAVGVPLVDVIAMATWNTAQQIHRENDLGALAPGREADITLLEIREEPVTLSDGYETMTTDKRLAPVGCFRAGQWLPTDLAYLNREAAE